MKSKKSNENLESGSPTSDLSSTTDAGTWARSFVRLHGGDEGLMIGWFANAIEAGRNAGRREAFATIYDLSDEEQHENVALKESESND